MQNTNVNARIWTFFAITILGLWLLVTPQTFDFKSYPLTLSNWICGVLLIFLGLKARKKGRIVWTWSMAAIGIWMQFTPLIFWAPDAAAYLNDTLVGGVVILLALVLYPLPGQLPDEEPSVPPGWSYNPSAWPARMFIALIAFVCWMISRYLTAYQLGYIHTVWDPFFIPGTKAVLESTISKAFPVPDAGLGAMAYTLEFFSTCLGGKNRWRTAPWAVIIFGILVIPVSFVSLVLIILQPLAVGTWCTLCLTTAGCMLIAIPFALGEVAATLQYLKRPRTSSFFSLVFKGGNCVNATRDMKPSSLDDSLPSLWKAALTGITIPWNLALTSALGILLMVAPPLFQLQGLADVFDSIAGALTIVVSVISMSEIVRPARYVNCLFGVWMLTQLFWLHSTIFALFYHGAIGVSLIVLSLRKGPIRERHSSFFPRRY